MCWYLNHPPFFFSCWDILPAAIRESRHVDGQLRRRRQVPILLLNHRAGKKLNFSPPFPCLLCFNHWIWCCFLYQSFWRRCMNAFGLRPLPFLMVSWYQKLKKDQSRCSWQQKGKFAGFLQAVFSTFLGTQPFLTHILPCLEELAKELQTKRHSTQYNNKKYHRKRKMPGLSVNTDLLSRRECRYLIARRWLCQVVCVRDQQGNSMSLSSWYSYPSNHFLFFSTWR